MPCHARGCFASAAAASNSHYTGCTEQACHQARYCQDVGGSAAYALPSLIYMRSLQGQAVVSWACKTYPSLPRVVPEDTGSD